MNYGRYLLLVLSVLIVPIGSMAGIIPPVIERDTTIGVGTHSVEYNISVDEDAVLTIAPGARILFSNDASILVYGGLALRGTATDPIVLTNEDPVNQGRGFKVVGKAEQDIVLNHVMFDGLSIPLTFSGLWQRRSVDIDRCIFKNINTGEPGIFINNAYPSNEYVFDFNFTHNKFIDNYSSIYVNFYESNNVNLRMEHNVITRNFIFGYSTEGADLSGSAPITFMVNRDRMKFPVKFDNNSIFGNYVTGIEDIYIRMSELNIGFRGITPGVYLGKNYFGPGKDKKAALGTMRAENASVIMKGILSEPSEETPLHVTSMAYHQFPVYQSDNEFVPWETQNFIDSFYIDFSGPVSGVDMDEVILSEIWDVLVTAPLFGEFEVEQNNLSYTNSNQSIVVHIPQSIAGDGYYKTNKRYYELSFKNEEGITETISIGKVYVDVFLLEEQNIFVFEKQSLTFQEYLNTYSGRKGERAGAGEETSPYMLEFRELERKISVASEVNNELLKEELKAFKKKWKKTPEWDQKEYRRIKEALEYGGMSLSNQDDI